MKKFIIVLVIGLFLTACTSVYVKEKLNVLDNSTDVVVLPHVELLTGVMAVAKGDNYRGPEEEGNYYYRDLVDFLDEYKNHRAFEISRQLSSLGLTYDAPYAFILQYEDIDDLANQVTHSEYVLLRATNKDLLDEFAIELYNLSQESNFYNQFYLKHKEFYKSLESGIAEEVRWTEIQRFMASIYGDLNIRCVTVLAPAAFPLGGYSIHIEDEVQDIFYNVQRSKSISNDKVTYDMKFISTCTVHEWSHVYVNPAVHELLEDYSNQDDLQGLFKRVSDKMVEKGYTTTETFLDEQIIRGITLCFVEEYMSEVYYEMELEYQESEGFYMTEYTSDFVKRSLSETESVNYKTLIKNLLDGYMQQ